MNDILYSIRYVKNEVNILQNHKELIPEMDPTVLDTITR